jgi:hypothetical protein
MLPREKYNSCIYITKTFGYYCSLNTHALFVAIPWISYPPVIKTLPSFNSVAVE